MNWINKVVFLVEVELVILDWCYEILKKLLIVFCFIKVVMNVDIDGLVGF